MGIFKAISNATTSTLTDQWKDIYVPCAFDEHLLVVPGVLKAKNTGSTNDQRPTGVISTGSKVFVPENTAAFVFSQGGIEAVLTEPGDYEYVDGEASIFSGSPLGSIFDQVAERVGFGGTAPVDKKIAFVNLREIRGIPFGTRGPQVYNDKYYKCDLEIFAYGTFSIKVTDPVKFVREFVPPNIFRYSVDYPAARKQLLSEFLQSFSVALNSLSNTFRIAELPSQATAIAKSISEDNTNAGSWPDRFGFQLVKVGIENIEFSTDSRELVRRFSEKRMSVSAFEESTQQAANIAAQQQIAQGIANNGLGEGGSMLFGMNMAQSLTPQAMPVTSEPTKPALSIDEQMDAVKKLKELLDVGILTQDEFAVKKKEILSL